jgi:O-antigen/teichoic acid export membrane protein
MYRALLTGLQDLATVGRLSLLGTAVWIAGAASLTAAGWGLYSPAAAWAASQAVPGLLAWRRVRSAYPGLDSGPAPAGPSGRELADLWGRGLLVTVSQFAVNLLRGGGMLVAGLAASPAAAAVYSCTAKLSELPQNYLQLGVGAALPGLSELRGGSDPARVARVATAMSSATLLLSGLASLTFLAVNEAFVGWWLGPELYGGLTLTALLAAGSLLWSWNVALAFGCYAFNRDLPLVMGTLGAAAASPAFGALLTNLSVGGPEAAAAGFLLALATVALPVNLWVLSDSSGVAATVLLRAWAPFFARLIPLWVAVWTVRGRWGPSGVAEALAASMAVAVVYGAVMWSLLGDECLAPYAGVVFDRLRLPRSWLPARAGAEARA